MLSVNIAKGADQCIHDHNTPDPTLRAYTPKETARPLSNDRCTYTHAVNPDVLPGMCN